MNAVGQTLYDPASVWLCANAHDYFIVLVGEESR